MISKKRENEKCALMCKSKKKSERMTSILGKKCALVSNKCNSCKKNMQEEKKVMWLNKHGFVI